MDFLFDDETIKKMNAEYDKLLKSTAKTLSTADDSENKTSETSSRVCADCTCGRYIRFLFLYIVVFLRYNSEYGTQIYDSHGSVGRLRPDASVFGSVNHLF